MLSIVDDTLDGLDTGINGVRGLIAVEEVPLMSGDRAMLVRPRSYYTSLQSWLKSPTRTKMGLLKLVEM